MIASPAFEKIASGETVLSIKCNALVQQKLGETHYTEMQRESISKNARAVFSGESSCSMGRFAIEKHLSDATAHLRGSRSQPIKVEMAVSCTNGKRAVALPAPLHQRMVELKVFCQDASEHIGMMVSLCATESLVLVERSMVEECNNLKT